MDPRPASARCPRARCDGDGAFCAQERARLGSEIMVMMWVFLTRLLRRWLFFALGAPVLDWVLGKVGDQLEANNGLTRASRMLQQGRHWLQRSSRGPLARRGTHR